MDSRIRYKVIGSAIEAACNCEGHKDGSVEAGFLGLAISNAIDEALLTAEPEPCESAFVVARRIDESMHCIEGTPGFERLVQVRSILDVEGVAKEIDSYASQVADKRAEELRARVETLREALEFYKDARGDEGDEIGGRAIEALAATEPKQ